MKSPALLVLWAALTACRPAHAPTSTSDLLVLEVDPDPDGRADYVLLRWAGEYDGSRALFVIVDEFGYAGLAETIGRSPRECDHCAGPLIEARLDSGSGAMDYGAIAVGPVDGPLPRARMKRVKLRSRDERWRTVFKLDLDGDGRWELEQVRRCGHMVRSGCSEEVCDRTCSAMTEPGREPEPKRIQCVSFVPDVAACPQDAE